LKPYLRIFDQNYQSYKLELPELGRGSFGIVYSVKDSSNDER